LVTPDELDRIEPVTRIEVLSDRITALGIVTGVFGGIGDSAAGVKIVDNGIRMALVDGVGNNETGVLTPERIHAEIVTRAVLRQPVIPGLDLAEAQIKKIKTNGERPEYSLIPDDPLFCMLAFAEVSDTQNGQFLVSPVGYGDVSIFALAPEAGGEFGVSSLRFLYFNPFADRSKDHIRAPRFHAVRQSELHAPNPSILPAGSVVILADDGGMEALINPEILLAAGSDYPKNRLRDLEWDFDRMISGSERGKHSTADYNSQLTRSLFPLMEIINRLGRRGAFLALFNSLSQHPQAVPDDVALLAAVVGEGKV
jgi:hypothetical protein